MYSDIVLQIDVGAGVVEKFRTIKYYDMGTKKAQNSELYFAPSEPPISAPCAPPLCTLRVQKFSLAPRIIYLSPLLQNIKETIMFLAFLT